MNTPTPVPTPEAPILPPEPWYRSEVQVRAVIALGAQLISILLRIVGRYTEVSVTTEMIDAIVADISQGVAILFGILAVTKRAQSEVQPLTLTAHKAAQKADTAQINPVTLEKRQAGFIRAAMLGMLLTIGGSMAVVVGCTNTARAVRNADVPADYALIFMRGYDSALKTANQLKDSGVLQGQNLERVRALELKAYPLVKPIPALQAAYEASRSATDAVALQKAVNDAIIAASEFIRAVQALEGGQS